MNRLVDCLIILILLLIDPKGTNNSRMYHLRRLPILRAIISLISQTIDEAEVNRNHSAQDYHVHPADRFAVPT
jgi:hypothetical protein